MNDVMPSSHQRNERWKIFPLLHSTYYPDEMYCSEPEQQHILDTRVSETTDVKR